MASSCAAGAGRRPAYMCMLLFQRLGPVLEGLGSRGRDTCDEARADARRPWCRDVLRAQGRSKKAGKGREGKCRRVCLALTKTIAARRAGVWWRGRHWNHGRLQRLVVQGTDGW